MLSCRVKAGLWVCVYNNGGGGHAHAPGPLLRRHKLPTL